MELLSSWISAFWTQPVETTRAEYFISAIVVLVVGFIASELLKPIFVKLKTAIKQKFKSIKRTAFRDPGKSKILHRLKQKRILRRIKSGNPPKKRKDKGVTWEAEGFSSRINDLPSMYPPNISKKDEWYIRRYVLNLPDDTFENFKKIGTTLLSKNDIQIPINKELFAICSSQHEKHKEAWAKLAIELKNQLDDAMRSINELGNIL